MEYVFFYQWLWLLLVVIIINSAVVLFLFERFVWVFLEGGVCLWFVFVCCCFGVLWVFLELWSNLG